MITSRVRFFVRCLTGSSDQPCFTCLAELHQVCQWSCAGRIEEIHSHLTEIHVKPDSLLKYVPGQYLFRNLKLLSLITTVVESALASGEVNSPGENEQPRPSAPFGAERIRVNNTKSTNDMKLGR